MVRKMLFLVSLAMMASSALAVGPASYEGDLQLNIEEGDSEVFQPGEQLKVDLSVANSGQTAIVDGYVIINIVRGGEPYYPSQKSNRDNVFRQDRIKDIYLKPGNFKELDYSYRLPEEIKGGEYRVEAYFKTNRTPVEGIPFIYSAPVSDSFQVSGSGTYPRMKISRTGTYLTGINKVKGDWDPDTVNFNGTMWPSLTGPVGVLTTSSMDEVTGKVKVMNLGSRQRSATLSVKVCEWDDTACSNRIDTVEKTFQVPPSGKEVPVTLDNPSEPGAYAVKFVVKSEGKVQSIYRNRIIREGNTTRIRKLSVNQPYVGAGDKLSVGLVASASADHYTDPSAVGVDAKVTVETLDGRKVMEKSKEIVRLSNFKVFEQLYFNKTLKEPISRYRVSASLEAEGKTYDRYSYIVDYSKFDNSPEKLKLRDYSFDDSGLKVELCAETSSGAPAKGEVQTILNKNRSIVATKKLEIDDCSSVEFGNVSEGTYRLTVNYGSQKDFKITPVKDGKKVNGETGGGDLPVVPVAVVIVLLLAVLGAVYLRGDRE